MPCHTDIIVLVQTLLSEVEREYISSVELGCWPGSTKSVQGIQGVSEPPVGTQAVG